MVVAAGALEVIWSAHASTLYTGDVPGAADEDLQPRLAAAAAQVEPRLGALATALSERDPGWRMSGSGSAFFCHTQTRAQAELAVDRVRDLGCPWTAVTRPLGPWG